MVDFYGREIQIGDRCLIHEHFTESFVEGTVLRFSKFADGGECIVLGTKFSDNRLFRSYKDRIIDVTAIEKEVRMNTFINSVKALDIKPNDTVVASLIPNQIPFREAENVFNQMKKVFPDNKVLLVMRLDVSIENGSDKNV